MTTETLQGTAGERERASQQMPVLLQEYTEKLHERCARYMDRPVARMSIVLTLLAVASCVAASWLILHRGPPVILDLYFLLGIVALCGGGIGLFVVWRLEERKSRQDSFDRLDLDMAATRLEKLIRVASQLEDHAVDDLATRIQLEIRLADAEATLSLARSLLESPTAKKRRELGDIGTVTGNDDERARRIMHEKGIKKPSLRESTP